MLTFDSKFFAKFCFLLIFSIANSGCELTQEDQSNIDDAFNPPAVEEPADDYEAQCLYERFVQPEGEIVKKIDILFVIDTSGSLDQERNAIANGIDAFVQELPDEVNYQVGVMYAHGKASNRPGELVGNPKVLSSEDLTLSQIRSNLASRMTNPKTENSTDGGEVGMYALYQALNSKLQMNKDAGFFRDDAALAVVFVADENDICSLESYPQGVTPVYDPNKLEWPAFDAYCEGISPQAIVDSVRSVKGDKPYLISGIIYTGDSPVPGGGENEIGYGYYETVEMANGVAVDLANGDYEVGMREIGYLAYKKINVITEFNLSRDDFVPETLEVLVDRNVVEHAYVSELNQIQIDSEDAGGERSEVIVNYCLPLTPPPVISGLRVFRITFTTADFEFMVDQSVRAEIHLTNMGNGQVTVIEIQGEGTLFESRAEGLIPNTIYRVEITVTNGEGVTSTEQLQFRTLNDEDLFL